VRRELIWAGIIGISFGLIIAFGVWRISSGNKISTIPKPVATFPSSNSEFKIVLSAPEDNDVVTENSLMVSGITKPLVWLTVSGEKGDYISQTDERGVFLVNVALDSGVNQIKITAFDPTGAQSVQKVLVVYSSNFQVSTIPSPTTSDNSTESALRQKVAEKVAEAMNKPKAYLGVVTDIADSTIQLKTTDGQIKQVSTISGNVSVVNIAGTNNKVVKLTDIAIGDFIVAMGYVNTASVLSAQRILVTDAVTDPKIDSFLGKVQSITSKTAVVSSLRDGQEGSITPSAKTDIETYTGGKLVVSKFGSIGINDLVIYVTDGSSATPTVRSIFIIQKSQGV